MRPTLALLFFILAPKPKENEEGPNYKKRPHKDQDYINDEVKVAVVVNEKHNITPAPFVCISNYIMPPIGNIIKRWYNVFSKIEGP